MKASDMKPVARTAGKAPEVVMSPMRLETTCFKIDRPNAKAILSGFPKNGELHRQSIWLAVRDLPFPALLTLQRAATRFKLSALGRRMDSDNFTMPLRYAATLVSEYFIKNDMALWETVCSNGLFDIWEPGAPYQRFAQAKSKPADFRIQLLRIHEIDHEFRPDDIRFVSLRIDRLVSPTREVGVIAPLISDPEFVTLTDLLERSVANYLTRPARRNVSLAPSTQVITDSDIREDIESLELENQYFEGEKTPRLSSYYERNPRLRAAAIRHHGTVCTICGFDFSELYGERGQGFVEVHHLIPVSSLKESTPVDPVSEMTVMCSNCHRMIHRRRDKILTPEQLREIVRRSRGP